MKRVIRNFTIPAARAAYPYTQRSEIVVQDGAIDCFTENVNNVLPEAEKLEKRRHELKGGGAA